MIHDTFSSPELNEWGVTFHRASKQKKKYAQTGACVQSHRFILEFTIQISLFKTNMLKDGYQLVSWETIINVLVAFL